MADNDEPRILSPLNPEFQDRVNAWAMKILEDANEHAQIDPVAASAAVVAAAGRVAAISGLEIGLQVQLFVHQFEMMRGLIQESLNESAPADLSKPEETN